jgi:hypothetical protein
MKKRYLLPIIYLILVALSFIIRSEGLLIILIAPQALISLGIEITLGIDFGDILYLLIFVGTILLFLFGYLFDAIAGYFRNKKY